MAQLINLTCSKTYSNLSKLYEGGREGVRKRGEEVVVGLKLNSNSSRDPVSSLVNKLVLKSESTHTHTHTHTHRERERE